MIKATMYWERMRLEVKGHAGFAEKGTDIVCAGASMLVQALVGSLDVAEQRGRCEYKAKNTEDGEAIIWAFARPGTQAEIKAYFRMCVTGLRMLQREYPTHVSVKDVE